MHQTAKQLFAYIDAKKAGKEYTGPLNEESKLLIEEFGHNLGLLEVQADAIHFMEDRMFG